MADDVKEDQIGSCSSSSHQSKNKKRANKRASRGVKKEKSESTLVSLAQAESANNKAPKKSKSEPSQSESKPEKSEKKKKSKNKKRKSKINTVQVVVEDSANTTGIVEQESKIRTRRTSSSDKRSASTEKVSASKETTKEGESSISIKKYSTRRRKSDSTISLESSATKFVKNTLKKTKSESEVAKSKLRKRKRKEILFYSPKRLRSSSSVEDIESKESNSSTSEAKTGTRNSRLRNPSGGAATSTSVSSSTNLGSCASSRRNRRWRNRSHPPAMENAQSDDNVDSAEPGGNSEQESSAGPLVGAVASLATSGSTSSQEGDIELGLEDSDMSRLQALLEARGLPAHLFGSLGPRMHLLLHKTFNSGAGSKAQQLITSMQNEEEGTQLQGAMEMCQLLVMGNEETLAGFPVKQVVPILITLLQMEHNFDIMNHACRALTYLMEALPRSSNVVVDAVPTLLEKLETIQCMDVAEQSLTALETLSKRHGKNVLMAGGLGASLLFLDFFSIVAQRSALAITANCCQSVTNDEFVFVKDSIQILTTRLNNQDKKSLEYVCTAFARLVDNLQNDKVILEALCEHGMLSNIKQLLVISPPIISSNTFVMVIRMLGVMCASCPAIAVKLIKLNIAETIRYLLIGSNDVPADEIVELIPRIPQELYELTCLISELLPKLPKTGVFSVDLYLNKGSDSGAQFGTWQWKDDRNTWHTYLWVDNRIIEAAYQSGEDEISLSTQGRNYIVDFSNMQQINEDTGTIRTIQRKSGSGQQVTITTKSKNTNTNEDERSIIFDKEPELGKNLIHSLISVIYDVYFSSVGPAVKHKCLYSILKMLHYGPKQLLKDALIKIPISSYIASMMSSCDLRIICSALQKADLLMNKLDDTFHVFFRREGVMHKIKKLADGNISGSPSTSRTKNNEVSPSTSRTKNNEVISNASSGTNISSTSSGTNMKKNLSNNDLIKVFDDLASASESNMDVEKSSSNSRIASLRSKKRSVKILTRRAAKSNEDNSSPNTSHSKKLSHEPTRPKSSTLASSTFTATGGSSKGSFFSNFAPRWGRSQSYQNTSASSSTTSTDKSIKERYSKEQEKNKEKIKAWIKTTAEELYEKYFSEEPGAAHPALAILKNLTTASNELSFNSVSDISALKGLHDVLLNDDTNADASPFEIVHSGMVNSLLKYLTHTNNKNDTPRNTRISRFLKVFLGIKDNSDIVSGKLLPSAQPALQSLVQKLNLCINQLEQFPVKCHDIPGANMGAGTRGSSALRFFNTHQIKCNLQRHPDCSNVKQWSGGAVKIDPLALVQAIERYLVVRGFAKVRDGVVNDMSDDEDHSDNDGEDLLVTLLQHSTNSKHVLEFTLNGSVLPYNMTVYQAVKQYAQNPSLNEDTDDESGPFGPSTIWSETHTLYYRPITKPLTAEKASSSKRSKSDTSSSSATTSSKTSLKNIVPNDQTAKQSHSSTFLTSKLPVEFCSNDPSIDVICLMRILYYLNTHWEKYLHTEKCGPVVSPLEFINTKLTAKATRQLQDPLVIMTGNLPTWLADLAKSCPFIFPFECRQLLFYTTTFDRDRAMMKLQETTPDIVSTDSSDRVAPRLDKKKRVVSRNDLFKQAEGVINEFSNSKALLEIQYQGEVGTGLGPTLEFYSLVSKEFQKSEYELWRGDDVINNDGDGNEDTKYTFSKNGLFPAPLPKNIKNPQLSKCKNRYKFLGKFIAKACMDCRMIDIPFSETFFKWLLHEEETIDLTDMYHVDETLYKSLSQLDELVKQKKHIINDISHSPESLQLALNTLTLDGTSVEDLGLDFTLPGTNIELKRNGKDTIVTIENIQEYLKLVIQQSLIDGVSKQLQAFKEGFEQFFPLSSLQMFYPSEMDVLLCGSKSQQWQVKELIECCRPDHGYTSDSRAVKFLYDILSKYSAQEQRKFLQFITGSPKLPVGGFKSLNPALTIVRKTVDGESNPDNYLPSVMTCVNYLKLPDYSSVKIMSEKLRTAYSEGKNAFHLS